jgi:hypothetical protein
MYATPSEFLPTHAKVCQGLSGAACPGFHSNDKTRKQPLVAGHSGPAKSRVALLYFESLTSVEIASVYFDLNGFRVYAVQFLCRGGPLRRSINRGLGF